MAIIQISKIQQRSGELVDLPQLDEAEFGFATDEKRLFIGKTTDNPENIEVLTSYSEVSFSQIEGSVGNLNVDPLTLEEGQVLAYDMTTNAWENRGGNSGGLINLGEVSNLKIDGGAIGYVLETDGTGNLSWQPKGVVTLLIQNITQDTNAVITFTDEFALSDGQLVTITGVTGMTEVNGNNYYLSNLTSTTANLYTDAGLSIPLDSSGFGAFPFTGVTDTTAVTNDITVADAALFTAGDAVKFIGNTFGGIIANTTYFILTADVTAPGNITITETQGSNVEVLLNTASGSCDVYVTGGKAVATVSGGGGGNTGTSANTQVLFNLNNVPAGDSKLTFIQGNGQLTLNGNAFVNNLTSNSGNIRGNILVSNVSTGTAPLTVNSTTRVTNLNADLLDNFDSSQTATANTVAVRDANANVVANNFTGSNVSLTGTLSITGNANVGNIGATNGVFTSVSGNGSALTNLNASNLSTGTVPSARLSGTYTITVSGSATTADTVTLNAQPNITSVGTLTSLTISGNANAGNIGATNFVGSGALLTNLNASNLSTGTVPSARLTGSYSISVTSATTAGTVTTNAQPNITSVGTLTSLSVTGNISAGNVNSTGLLGGTGAEFRGNVISTGANTTAGTITGNWTLTAGSRLQATYADLAEYYAADDHYIIGTVLAFGGTEEVTLAGEETNKLAGVVSAEPAYVMNGGIQCNHPTMIALIGRVPVRVIGPVSKGDMLVSAGQGLAKATILTPKVGTVIGKAIQNKYDDGIGIVEVMVGRI